MYTFFQKKQYSCPSFGIPNTESAKEDMLVMLEMLDTIAPTPRVSRRLPDPAKAESGPDATSALPLAESAYRNFPVGPNMSLHTAPERFSPPFCDEPVDEYTFITLPEPKA